MPMNSKGNAAFWNRKSEASPELVLGFGGSE